MGSVKHCCTAFSEVCGEVKSCMELPAAAEMVHLSSQKALDKVRHQAPLHSRCMNWRALECSSGCALSTEATEMGHDTELLWVTEIRVECEELQKILMVLVTGEYNGRRNLEHRHM